MPQTGSTETGLRLRPSSARRQAQETAQCFPSRVFPELSSRPEKEQLLGLGFSAVVGLWLQEFDSKSSNFFNASKHFILKARRIITILI